MSPFLFGGATGACVAGVIQLAVGNHYGFFSLAVAFALFVLAITEMD